MSEAPETVVAAAKVPRGVIVALVAMGAAVLIAIIVVVLVLNRPAEVMSGTPLPSATASDKPSAAPSPTARATVTATPTRTPTPTATQQPDAATPVAPADPAPQAPAAPQQPALPAPPAPIIPVTFDSLGATNLFGISYVCQSAATTTVQIRWRTTNADQVQVQFYQPSGVNFSAEDAPADGSLNRDIDCSTTNTAEVIAYNSTGGATTAKLTITKDGDLGWTIVNHVP